VTRRSVFLILIVLWASQARALPVTFLVTPPTGTAAELAVYLAGDFQGWQPGDPAWQLQPTGDGRWALTAEFTTDQGLQFKFTLGSWLTVEKDSGGAEIANRLHVVTRADTLHLVVGAWADGRPVQRPETITGRVETFSLPDFLAGRRVWVYLPSGYEDRGDCRYPVLYLFDGQNVFNEATSFAGEWRVDETLEQLISAGRVAPLIVVAVDNGGGQRTAEYTPWPSRQYAGSGGGQDHLKQWLEFLLPHVNATYRTRSGADQTGLGGSSLGGLMSLYGGFAHPEIFGRVGAFSPTLHTADERLLRFCAEQPDRPPTVYVDMGTREQGFFSDRDHNGTDDAVDLLRRLQKVLQGRGYLGGWDLLLVEDEGGQHNEAAWARRFPAAVEFLFPAE